MNISSVVVYARPEERALLSARLRTLPGVEVHGASCDGRLVVTLETRGDGADLFQAVERTEGVLAMALVYQHQEPDAED